MDLSIEQTRKIAKKLKILTIINYSLYIINLISILLLFLIFIDPHNGVMIIGIILQCIILIPVLFLIKYCSDIKISKLFKQISDKFDDKMAIVFLRNNSLKTLWLKFNGGFWFYFVFLAIHRPFISLQLNNYIFRGAKKILKNK